MLRMILASILTTLILSGCGQKNLLVGKWDVSNSRSEHHSFIEFTANEVITGNEQHLAAEYEVKNDEVIVYTTASGTRVGRPFKMVSEDVFESITPDALGGLRKEIYTRISGGNAVKKSDEHLKENQHLPQQEQHKNTGIPARPW